MKLVTANPLQEFYAALGRSPVKSLNVVSPFITLPAIKELIGEFRRRRTKIQILTNLSGLNVALSLANPISPLLEILDVLGDRVTIKGCSTLHAKLFISDGRAALVGSSNLTYGGMVRNTELNWMIRGRKKEDKLQIQGLESWFDQIWADAGKPLTRKDLVSIEDRWKGTQARIMGIVSEFIPEPRLGGDYWKKIQEITRRKEWKRKDIEKKLSVDEEESAKNATQKLVFLKQLGLLDFSQTTVMIHRKMTSPLEMYTLLGEGHLQISLKSILQGIQNSKSGRMSYKALSKELGVPNDGALHVSTKWLESLGYIARHRTSGFHEFTLTKKANVLKSSETGLHRGRTL